MNTLSYLQPKVRDGGERDYPDTPVEGGLPPSDEQMLDLRKLLNILWRRKMIIVATAFIITTLAILGVLRAVPLYVAVAQVVVENERRNPLGLAETYAGPDLDYYTNQTEAKVIASRGIAEKVVDELNLMQHPLFNPALAEPERSLWSDLDLKQRLLDWSPDWLREEYRRLKSSDQNGPVLTPAQQQAKLREDIVNAFLAGAEVVADERSRVLEIQYVSPDPEFSAQAANALAQTYINQSILRKYEYIARATDVLNQRVGELRNKLEASEKALEEHRRKIGYINLEGRASILGQQLAQLNIDLVRARSDRAEAEARYRQVQKLLESPGGIESATTVLDSPLIQRLREQEAAVIRQLAELRTQLRGQHPRLILKENELADLNAKIRAEVQKIGINLGNELEIARILEANTAEEVEKIKAAINKQNEDLVTLRALESDVEANNALYAAILQRFKETDVQDKGLQEPDARMISTATPPVLPSYPRKGLIVAMALVASIALGVILVFVVEHLDAGFRTLAQVEQVTGYPAIGQVPILKGWRFRHTSLQDVVVEQPGSLFSEAIRTVRTAINLSSNLPPDTVLITSAMPGEGKTSIALSLARSASKAGQRVVIVDCDMRAPSLHLGLGVPNIHGLAEFLTGECALEDVLEIDDFSGVHFITAGQFDYHVAELLGSSQMDELLSRLNNAYDLVVFDSPPILAVSDVRLLLKRIAKSVLVVRWGETSRDHVLTALRMMQDAKANIAGVVLSQVDMRRQRAYSNSGDSYGYGTYGTYHQG